MQTFIPSQTALVLGGGGAKGSYETGVFDALAELGIRAGSVYGVSIGSINAAMYAQGELELAAELWKVIRLSDLVGEDMTKMVEDVENITGHPERIVELAAKYAQHKGLDVTPLKNLLEKYIREDIIRKSSIKLSLLTTGFPSMAMTNRSIDTMEPGTLIDWIMASSACFPIFPMYTIGNDKYIDGGYVDNAPVGLAVKDGARQIIAIDIGKHPSHLQYEHRPNVTYIRPMHYLGGMMSFTPELAARNRILGYNDTMRTFGHMRGMRYSFDPKDAQALYGRAEDFVVRLTQLEVEMDGQHVLTRNDHYASLFTLMEEEMPARPDVIDYLIRAFELLAQIAELDPAQVFTFETFRDSIRAALPIDRAEGMLDSLLGGRIGVLFSEPAKDRKLVVAGLYHLLQRESTLSTMAMHTLARFPKEFLCALTLKEIL